MTSTYLPLHPQHQALIALADDLSSRQRTRLDNTDPDSYATRQEYRDSLSDLKRARSQVEHGLYNSAILAMQPGSAENLPHNLPGSSLITGIPLEDVLREISASHSLQLESPHQASQTLLSGKHIYPESDYDYLQVDEDASYGVFSPIGIIRDTPFTLYIESFPDVTSSVNLVAVDRGHQLISLGSYPSLQEAFAEALPLAERFSSGLKNITRSERVIDDFLQTHRHELQEALLQGDLAAVQRFDGLLNKLCAQHPVQPFSTEEYKRFAPLYSHHLANNFRDFFGCDLKGWKSDFEAAHYLGFQVHPSPTGLTWMAIETSGHHYVPEHMWQGNRLATDHSLTAFAHELRESGIPARISLIKHGPELALHALSKANQNQPLSQAEQLLFDQDGRFHERALACVSENLSFNHHHGAAFHDQLLQHDLRALRTCLSASADVNQTWSPRVHFTGEANRSLNRYFENSAFAAAPSLQNLARHEAHCFLKGVIPPSAFAERWHNLQGQALQLQQALSQPVRVGVSF